MDVITGTGVRGQERVLDLRAGTDLRQDARWAPLVGTFAAPGWKVDLWEEPRLPGEMTADMTLVSVLGDVLRLAVGDPAFTCPTVSVEEALRSGQKARNSLRCVSGLARAMDDAARA